MGEYDLTGSVAFSYARFSDISQGAGHSLERQQEYAPEFCREHGCKLNTTLRFSDLGKSAFHGRHLESGGGLNRFLECIQAGLVQPGDVLVIENLDRVSRLPLDEAEDLLKSILSQGVRIHTRSPWSIYDRDTLRDPMQRMQMIFEFTRGHRESKYKQERLGRRWIKNRESARAGDYKVAVVPAWLEVVRTGEKVTGYRVIKDRAKVIAMIFSYCIEGLGVDLIAKKLNREGVEPFGRSKHWQRSTVSKVLRNRAVLGEYQPHSSVKVDRKSIESTKRVASGEPIADYFPRIVSDEVFESADAAMEERKGHITGKGSSKVTNLFAGLIRDARDGSNVFCVDKGYGPRLVSNSTLSGVGEAIYIDYQLLENAFAVHVHDMDLKLVVPKDLKHVDKTISDLRREVKSLEIQVAKIKEKSRTNISDALLELLVERDAELKTKQQELTTMERARGSSALEAAKSTRELLKAIQQASGDELLKIRSKIRSEIRYWCKQVVILPMLLGDARALMISVELQNGEWLDMRSCDTLVQWPEQLDELQAKDFAKWPKSLRKTHWEVQSEFDRRLLELNSKSLTFAQIAEEMESTVSVVSKRLLALGQRRMSKRRSFTPDRMMNWHDVGRGWVRSYEGTRHYVGVGTLKKLYPKVVTSNDETGTQRAANKWWSENVLKKTKASS